MRDRTLVTCSICNKLGYSYRTYYQHYNEPPVGKIMLKGKVIGDIFRRCYLPKGEVKAKLRKHNRQRVISMPILKSTNGTDRYIKPSISHLQPKIKQIKAKKNNIHLLTLDHYVSDTNESQLKKSITSSRNIECPSCHQNGVLNVATNKDNPEKVRFYVSHEKLGGTWGIKSKVNRIRRCYISTRNREHTEYLKRLWNRLTISVTVPR